MRDSRKSVHPTFLYICQYLLYLCRDSRQSPQYARVPSPPPCNWILQSYIVYYYICKEEKFKNEVEPLLLDVYAKQQAQIEALEEELSKTKFDLFEKQKETLSLKKDNDELTQKGEKLESELNSVQQKMDGILNVIQGNTKELEEEKITE